MNQKIRELAQQAELNATLLFNKDKLEKFVELIVRECALCSSNEKDVHRMYEWFDIQK